MAADTYNYEKYDFSITSFVIYNITVRYAIRRTFAERVGCGDCQ
jgi:hypothetical protein